jgi:hypothetical protein
MVNNWKVSQLLTLMSPENNSQNLRPLGEEGVVKKPQGEAYFSKKKDPYKELSKALGDIRIDVERQKEITYAVMLVTVVALVGVVVQLFDFKEKSGTSIIINSNATSTQIITK